MNCFYTYTSCILLCFEIFLLLLSNSRKCHIPFSCLHKYLHRVPGQEHLTTSSIPAETNSLNEAWFLCFKIKFDILCKHTVSFITDSFLPKEVYNIKRKLSVSISMAHLNSSQWLLHDPPKVQFCHLCSSTTECHISCKNQVTDCSWVTEKMASLQWLAETILQENIFSPTSLKD